MERRTLDKLIAKIENGEEKFRTSALFNKTMMTLAQGVDPIVIIDQLIDINEKQAKEFQKYMEGDYRPFVIAQPST